MYIRLQGRSNGRHVKINSDGSISFRWAASGNGCDGCTYCLQVRNILHGHLRSRKIEFSADGEFWTKWQPDTTVTEETLEQYLSTKIGLQLH